MKLLLANLLLMGSFVYSAVGQGAQADMIKQRAKETVNQNNVRQGVPAPAQTQTRPVAATAVTPTAPASSPTLTPEQLLAKIKVDLAGFKPGAVATAEQKHQLLADLNRAARAAKPSPVTLKKFVDSFSAALPGATLTAEQQGRLAENLEAVLNAKAFPAEQFNRIIEDVQAILEVGAVKRLTALSVAADLKAVGFEVRR